MEETIVSKKDSTLFTNITGEELKPQFSTKGDYQGDEVLAKKVNRDLDKLPPIAEACDKFIAQIKAEQREDMDLVITDFRVNDLGVLVKKDGSPVGDNAYLKMLPQAWTQLTRQAPNNVDKRLKSNVNAWLHRKQATLVGRSFNPKEHSRELYSLVTQRYQAFDADSVAAAIAKAPGLENCKGSVKYLNDGGRYEVDAALARPFDIDGDIHKIIVSVRSSDNGTLGQSVFFKAHRLKCTNGIFVAQRALINRMRHIGDRNVLEEQFSLGLAKAAEAMEAFTSMWKEARAAKFTCAVSHEEISGPEALARLAVHKRLTVPHVRPQQLLEMMMGAFEKEPGDRVSDVINAATRTAHESAEGFRNRWFSDDLEEQAGVLLSGGFALNPIHPEIREKMGLA